MTRFTTNRFNLIIGLVGALVLPCVPLFASVSVLDEYIAPQSNYPILGDRVTLKTSGAVDFTSDNLKITGSDREFNGHLVLGVPVGWRFVSTDQSVRQVISGSEIVIQHAVNSCSGEAQWNGFNLSATYISAYRNPWFWSGSISEPIGKDWVATAYSSQGGGAIDVLITTSDTRTSYSYRPIQYKTGARIKGPIFGCDVRIDGASTQLESSAESSSAIVAQANGSDLELHIGSPLGIVLDYSVSNIDRFTGDLKLNNSVDVVFCVKSMTRATLGISYDVGPWAVGFENRVSEWTGLAAESRSVSGTPWDNLLGRKAYASDTIILHSQRMFFRLANPSTEGWSGEFGIGRLALTGNVKEYDLPLFLITYRQTLALPIDELWFADISGHYRWRILDQIFGELSIRQYIPISILQSSGVSSGSDSNNASSSDKSSSSGSWGGLSASLALNWPL